MHFPPGALMISSESFADKADRCLISTVQYTEAPGNRLRWVLFSVAPQCAMLLC